MDPELGMQIAQAMTLVAERSDGHLPLPVRQRLTRAVLDRARDPRVAVVALDAMPVAQLAHLVGDDELDRLDEVVALARRAISDPRLDQWERVEQAQDDCLARADKAWTVDEWRSRALWFGAAGMLGAILTAEGLVEGVCSEDDVDDDPQRDPDAWDPAFQGSLVASGSVPDDPDSDIRLRRRYWWWWLREAIPAAGGPVTPSQVIDDRHRGRWVRDLLLAPSWSDEELAILRLVLGHRAPLDSVAWNPVELQAEARAEQARIGS